MQKECQDGFYKQFSSYEDLYQYQKGLSIGSQWLRVPVNSLEIEPLDSGSPLYGMLSEFAPGTTEDAVEDTAQNLGLAMRVEGQLYPVRTTAYKSLLDRAKVSGQSFAKMSRKVLASVLNECLSMYDSKTLVLIRNEKVVAAHSGDEVDYSVLPIDELLIELQQKLDDRFSGSDFQYGYCDHSLVSASWTMPGQKEDLLGTYTKLLESQGKSKLAAKLVPGIRFTTSDAGVASAKVAALLVGGQHPIYIGECIAVNHRHNAKIADFELALDQLFAQFGKTIERLHKMTEINLEYPVNAMIRICKKFSLPKKAAVEAIQMFEMTYGGGAATAHDVFLAMQEIPFILKTQHFPEAKLLTVEENMARILTIKWSDFDLAKAVDY